MRDDENNAATIAILKTRSRFDVQPWPIIVFMIDHYVVMLVGFQQDLSYNQITMNPSF